MLSHQVSIAELLLAYFQKHGLSIYRSTDTKVETMHFPNERRGTIYSVTPQYKHVTYFNVDKDLVESTSLDSFTEEEIKNLKGLNDYDKKAVKNYVVDTDEGLRAETTIEGLAKLKPAFAKENGFSKNRL